MIEDGQNYWPYLTVDFSCWLGSGDKHFNNKSLPFLVANTGMFLLLLEESSLQFTVLKSRGLIFSHRGVLILLIPELAAKLPVFYSYTAVKINYI